MNRSPSAAHPFNRLAALKPPDRRVAPNAALWLVAVLVLLALAGFLARGVGRAPGAAEPAAGPLADAAASPTAERSEAGDAEPAPTTAEPPEAAVTEPAPPAEPRDVPSGWDEPEAASIELLDEAQLIDFLERTATKPIREVAWAIKLVRIEDYQRFSGMRTRVWTDADAGPDDPPTPRPPDAERHLGEYAWVVVSPGNALSIADVLDLSFIPHVPSSS